MNRCCTMLCILFLLMGCKRASPECLDKIHKLRARIALIDWSVVGNLDGVAPAEVPIGSGHTVPKQETWEWRFPIEVDGSVVRCDGDTYSDHATLDKQVAICGRTFRTGNRAPIYVLATKKTPVAVLRRIAAALEPSGEVRLTVRPAFVVEPWSPSQSRRAFYEHTTREVPREKHDQWSDDLAMSVLVPAKGCSEAVDVAKHPWMSPGDRLARLPEAFEKCACDGDMDTMAALYWFQALHGYLAIRWNAWDEAVADQVGNDATYEQLANALSAKYLAGKK